MVERDVVGCDHAMLGAALLGQWGLTSAVIEAVQRHHAVSFASDIALDATTAVAIADRLARDVERFSPGMTAANPALVASGDPRWPWWRELAEQLAMDGMAV
jgi:HD-like signal output (HDOD) protein